MSKQIDQDVLDFIHQEDPSKLKANLAPVIANNHLYSLVAAERNTAGKIVNVMTLQSYMPLTLELRDSYAEVIDEKGNKLSGSVEFSATITRRTTLNMFTTTYLIFEA